MARHPGKSRVYKDSTAQQLRSFWETHHRGTFRAAAVHLELADQTVWQQVRALEKEFGETLLVRDGRRCHLTEAGQTLAGLIGPVVESLATLKRRFQEIHGRRQPRLVVATTPRILAEDLPECVVDFRRQFPTVSLTLREMGDDTVLEAIDEGEAELGIGTKRALDVTRDPWLEFEPLYDTAIFLVTAAGHPLARRRRIRVDDLLRYPLLNAVPGGVPDLVTLGVLQRAGTTGGSSPLVEVQFAATIRRYAALGLGIGLVPAPLTRQPGAGLHERDMSQHFGTMAVYRLSRKGVPLSPQAAAFTSLVRDRLHKRPPRRR